MHHTPGLGHFWTLAIEEQFYLLWPLCVWWLGRRDVFLFSVCGCAGALLVRYYLLQTGTTSWAVWHLTTTRFDSLLYGAIIATMYHYRGKLWKQFCQPVTGYTIGLLLVPIILLSYGDPEHLLMQTLGYSLLGLLFAWWIARHVFLHDQPQAPAVWWNAWPLRTIGRWSYAVYVFHWPVLLLTMYVLEKLFFERTIAESQVLFGAVMLSLAASATILISGISWYCYESQWLKLKRRFQYSATSQGSACQ